MFLPKRSPKTFRLLTISSATAWYFQNQAGHGQVQAWPGPGEFSCKVVKFVCKFTAEDVNFWVLAFAEASAKAAFFFDYFRVALLGS